MLQVITALSRQSPIVVVAIGYVPLFVLGLLSSMGGPFWLPDAASIFAQLLWLGGVMIGIVIALFNLAYWRRVTSSLVALVMAAPLMFVWLFPRG